MFTVAGYFRGHRPSYGWMNERVHSWVIQWWLITHEKDMLESSIAEIDDTKHCVDAHVCEHH